MAQEAKKAGLVPHAEPRSSVSVHCAFSSSHGDQACEAVGVHHLDEVDRSEAR